MLAEVGFSAPMRHSAELFPALKSSNPYETELSQVVRMFSTDVKGNNDIDRILHALQEAFGYKAFEENAASQTEVDDLANRLQNYSDVKRFVEYETDLLTAVAYCGQKLAEDDPNLKPVIREQRKLAKKLSELQPYVDAEVKLKTELIGKIPADGGESGTLGSLVREYLTVYATVHDNVVDEADQARKAVDAILGGDEFKALRILEGVVALQPPFADQAEKQLRELRDAAFSCPSPSRASVEEQLKRGPLHECGLSLQTAPSLLQQAQAAADSAAAAFDARMNSKLEVFLTPAVQERLQQGKSEKVIAKMLACKDLPKLRTVLVKACLDDAKVVTVINKYLKKIVVKRVKMSDFKPTVSTVEKEQIPVLANEFREYLEKAMSEIDKDDDVLPMIQVE